MADNTALLHKILDGDASLEERRAFSELTASDEGLRREFEALKETVHLVETCEPAPLPASFTSGVMKRLPRRGRTVKRDFRSFLFGERIFRWNMAAAAAVAALFAVILGGIVQVRNGHVPVSFPASENPVNYVTFTLQAPEARVVAVAGDFNRWSLEKGIMKKRQNGLWSLEVPLRAGSYNYMFVVDGRVWMPDPKAQAYQDDGFGSRNSVVRVGTL